MKGVREKHVEIQDIKDEREQEKNRPEPNPGIREKQIKDGGVGRERGDSEGSGGQEGGSGGAGL